MIDETPRRDERTPPHHLRHRHGAQCARAEAEKAGPLSRSTPRTAERLLIVNTGDGKGKTTAALGLLLRATGRGMRVGMFQFVKRMPDAGEHRAAAARRRDHSAGRGCTIGREDVTTTPRWREAGNTARKCSDGEYDVLILDELTLPVPGDGSTSRRSLLRVGRPRGTHVVITGRYAPQALIDAADLVTEMRVIKHPLREQGITPRQASTCEEATYSGPCRARNAAGCSSSTPATARARRPRRWDAGARRGLRNVGRHVPVHQERRDAIRRAHRCGDARCRDSTARRRVHMVVRKYRRGSSARRTGLDARAPAIAAAHSTC